MPYDATLGRLSFVTIQNNVVETLGNTLDTVGGGVVPGERRPRALTLDLPVRGSYGPSPNVLLNPSAAANTAGWTSWVTAGAPPSVTRVTGENAPGGITTAFEVTGTPVSGADSVQFQADAGYQPCAVMPGDTARVGCYVRPIAGVGGTIGLGPLFFDANGNYVSQGGANLPLVAGWQWIEMTGLVPGGIYWMTPQIVVYSVTPWAARTVRATGFLSTTVTDPSKPGERLRRQARSMFDNDALMLAGISFKFAVDPDLNGWLVMAGGELSYTDGGVSVSDYGLELRDAYKVGSRWTHRPARRFEVYDRRLATTPRDILGVYYSTDFAGFNPMATKWWHALPVASSDVVGQSSTMGTPTLLTGQYGTTPIVFDRPHGEVVSFEHAASDEGRNDVVVYDRRGRTYPTGSASDPQTAYGWEEVYGRNYPLTSGDLPVLANGHARVRWNAATSGWILEFWTAGAYVEQGRLGMFDGGTYAFNVLGPSVLYEWTPERAVLRYAILSTATPPQRADVFVILARGWFGPRVEMYTGYGQTAWMRYTPAISGNFVYSGGTISTWSGSIAFTDFVYEPWGSIQGAASGDQMNFAVMDSAVSAYFTANVAEQYGSARNGVDFLRGGVAGKVGHLSVRYSAAPRNTATADTTMTGAKGVAIYNLFDARAIPELVVR